MPNLANASALLYETLPDLNWAGFYLVDPDSAEKDLLLGPFQGKPACIRIPKGKGVCGTAYATDTLQCVYDVHKFPGHIACDSASNSEIVIPLHRICPSDSGVTAPFLSSAPRNPLSEVIGVLDIDSPVIGRFTEEDVTGLTAFVRLLEEACDL